MLPEEQRLDVFLCGSYSGRRNFFIPVCDFSTNYMVEIPYINSAGRTNASGSKPCISSHE
jgi:hypothetical protein